MPFANHVMLARINEDSYPFVDVGTPKPLWQEEKTNLLGANCGKGSLKTCKVSLNILIIAN